MPKVRDLGISFIGWDVCRIYIADEAFQVVFVKSVQVFHVDRGMEIILVLILKVRETGRRIEF